MISDFTLLGPLHGAMVAALCLAPVSLLSAQSYTVTDIDGNVYQTVRVGSQIWMKENLKTTRLNDGTAISSISDEAGWRAATGPAWCVYSNSQEKLILKYKGDYGLLYNGHVVATGKLAPAGWHVPTREEWMEMIDHLGGLDAIGAKVKEAGTNHWRPPNHLANNSSGFSARGRLQTPQRCLRRLRWQRVILELHFCGLRHGGLLLLLCHEGNVDVELSCWARTFRSLH